MDHEFLRRLGKDTSDEMNVRMDQRLAQHRRDEHERVDTLIAALEERTAECERLLGIERDELHDAAYDALAAGDDTVFWDDMDQRRVPPNVARKMAERRGYSRP